MELDIRQIPPGDRLERALDATRKLGPREVLTLLADEDAPGLADSLKTVLDSRFDIQPMRWGVKDLPFVIHLKKSLKPSAYHPEEEA